MTRLKFALSFLLTFCIILQIHAQQPLTYYLPDHTYDPAIPTPASVLGFQVGEWHISHDKQYMYLQALAAASDRVELVEYARSHEERPLIYLRITTPEHQRNIETIRTNHLKLSDPNASKGVDVADMPIVIYQGFSIHGNEASGGNAAPLIAYYLAASQDQEVIELLENAVVLLDPCFNPDGFHRFSTWVNMHKNKNLTSDPQDREYDESWPGARTNHYWFDLNRDWLPVQHPESQGRIKVFHEWKPNILTDHHEMGINATFFFQPGVPERLNPITPLKNQSLTEKISTYHAAALDKIGSLYYSKEGFDDFYYGKGSTYPDANGCIGILFEQASSRGHLQETVNGDLSFPFTIRNQVTTALSTQKAGLEMRAELLEYQKEFYVNAQKEANTAAVKGYVFSDPTDQTKVHELLKILVQHQIEVHQLAKTMQVNGETFEAANSYIVPTDQTQHRLVRGMFETMTTFNDSLFYDISTWTFPLTFNLQNAALSKGNFSKNALGKKIELEDITMEVALPELSQYAYLFEWGEYLTPKALYAIQAAGLRTKVASIPFTLNGKSYGVGTILIPVANQVLSPEMIHEKMKEVAAATGVKIDKVDTGLTPTGIDLGSRDFEDLEMPKILLVVGEGVTSYDAGEVWHLFDQRYDVPISMVETGQLSRTNLDRYNVIIMPSGSYYNISASGVNKLKTWSAEGGTIVAVRNAVRWLDSKNLVNIDFISAKDSTPARRPYAKRSADSGSRVIGGAIFESTIDLTNPIFYGYSRAYLPVFRRGTLFFKPTNNRYATPSTYTDDPLMSGYIKADNAAVLKNTANVIISGTGSGRTICIADNPNFRAFWYGTNKYFANAVFFGQTISSSAVQR